jgi:hypothetical protein
MVYYRQCCGAGAVGPATFWSWSWNWSRSQNYWSGSGSGYVKSKILSSSVFCCNSATAHNFSLRLRSKNWKFLRLRLLSFGLCRAKFKKLLCFDTALSPAGETTRLQLQGRKLCSSGSESYALACKALSFPEPKLHPFLEPEPRSFSCWSQSLIKTYISFWTWPYISQRKGVGAA